MRRQLWFCLFLGFAVSSTIGQQPPVPRTEPVLIDQFPSSDAGVTLDKAPAGKFVVQAVEPGSPADRAGLKAGDEILTADGNKFATQAELMNHLRTHRGSAVKFVVSRNGQNQDLIYHDSVGAVIPPTVDNHPLPKYGQTAGLGFRIGYDANGRIIVIGLHEGGPADRAGIQLLDQLLAVDGVNYKSTRDMAQAIGRLRTGDTVHLDVARGTETRRIDVVLADWPAAFNGPRRMAPNWVAIDDDYGWTDYGRPNYGFWNDGTGFTFGSPGFVFGPWFNGYGGWYADSQIPIISDEQRYPWYYSEPSIPTEMNSLRRENLELRKELELARQRLKEQQTAKP